LPLTVALDVPKLSLAGFTTNISGTLTANGTAVPGAIVSVATPWGEFQAQSNSSGRYTLALPVSIFEFNLSKDLNVSATPSQPYIAAGNANARVSLFNPLLIILPALGAGVTAYELESLGLTPRLRGSFRRANNAQTAELATRRPLLASPNTPLGPTERSSGIILLYLQALTLASRRLRIDFKESDTMREMIGEVWKLDGGGAAPFAIILFMTEDFLYSREFDLARVKVAEENLSKLRELWGD